MRKRLYLLLSLAFSLLHGKMCAAFSQEDDLWKAQDDCLKRFPSASFSFQRLNLTNIEDFRTYFSYIHPASGNLSLQEEEEFLRRHKIQSEVKAAYSTPFFQHWIIQRHASPTNSLLLIIDEMRRQGIAAINLLPKDFIYSGKKPMDLSPYVSAAPLIRGCIIDPFEGLSKEVYILNTYGINSLFMTSTDQALSVLAASPPEVTNFRQFQVQANPHGIPSQNVREAQNSMLRNFFSLLGFYDNKGLGGRDPYLVRKFER